MENEDREMNKFLPGDLDKLIDSITDKYGLHSSEYEDYTYVEMHKRTHQITMNLLVQLVLTEEPGYPQQDFNRLNRYLKEFWCLIHGIPLKKVPLYLNTIPDVANWRLRIGR